MLMLAFAGARIEAATTQPPQGATEATRAWQQQENQALPLADRQDYEDARRGFIATRQELQIKDAQGRVVWDLGNFDFLDQEESPDTVHPGLWRQAQLNRLHGLFKVTDGIYQVRGFDIANVTLVEGEKGLIVIDPLTSVETAQAALALYFEHRPKRPISAVIYTHSHADHFGGVKGVVSEEAVQAGQVPIYAPAGFLEEAVSENVLAGNAMLRRAQYQFGNTLPRNASGFVDAGLGKSGYGGTISLIAPTVSISGAQERHVIDGVEVIFQTAPASEAPAEMHLYFPASKVLNLAENATHTLHNLLPIRGAQVRDAKAWANYLNLARQGFASRSEVVIAQHHWPTWGQASIQTFLARQRDLYKFIHDQTLRLANHGFTADEIAEQIRLPASLQQDWSTHGLYGSLRHNVKAVYQRYLGWYDANPAHLDALPGVAAARKSVEYMGGSPAILKKARQDFATGQYRWVAQVTNLVVQAEPGNAEARELNARAFEQLGYRAESSTWRNAYLVGAQELRQGEPEGRGIKLADDLLDALTLENIFDALAVRLNGEKAEGKRSRVNWEFTDSGERYFLNLDNSALTYLAGHNDAAADVSVRLTRKTFGDLLAKRVGFREVYLTGLLQISGDRQRLADIFDSLDNFPGSFPIVTPRRLP